MPAKQVIPQLFVLRVFLSSTIHMEADMARSSAVSKHQPFHTMRINMHGVYGYVRGHTLVLTASSFHPSFDPRSTEPGWVVGADTHLVSSFRYSPLRLGREVQSAHSEEIEAILILERDPMVMMHIKLVLSLNEDIEYHWVAYPVDAQIPPLKERPCPPRDKHYDRVFCKRGDDPNEQAIKVLMHYFWSLLRDMTDPGQAGWFQAEPEHVFSEYMAGRCPISPGNAYMDMLAGSVERSGAKRVGGFPLEMRCLVFGLKEEEVNIFPEDPLVFTLTKSLSELATEAIERMLAPEEVEVISNPNGLVAMSA